MKTGRYSSWPSAVVGQSLTGHQAWSTTDDVWSTNTFSCWHQTARHSLGSAQNCLGPAGLQDCVHTGCQRIPQMMTKLIVWDCMGFSYIHWTCYTDQLKHG